jgi:hypothetical protein
VQFFRAIECCDVDVVPAVAEALSIWFGGLAACRGWGCVAGCLADIRYGPPYRGSSGCMAGAAWLALATLL